MSSILYPQNTQFPDQDLNKRLPGANEKSLLILIAPNRARVMSIQAHRPLQYRITPEFATFAHDRYDEAMSAGSALGRVSEQLAYSPHAGAVVLGQGRPDAIIDMSMIDQAWKFIFILNNPPIVDAMDPHISSFSGLADIRVYHYGYFIGEPINPLTYTSTHVTANPDAMMVVTHKSVVEQLSTMGPYGRSANRISTRMDNQIIPTQTVPTMTSDPNMNMIDPSSVWDGISWGANGSSIAMGSPSSMTRLSAQGQAKVMASELQNPVRNLETLCRNISMTYQEQSTNNYLNNYIADVGSLDQSFAQNSFHETLRNNMTRRPESVFMRIGLQENETISMGMIMTRYQPRVEQLYPEQSTLFAGGDQTAANINNVFSDLLCNMVPPVMVKLGISSITFRYQSLTEVRAPEPFAFQLQNVEPMMWMPTDELNRRVQALITELQRSLFATMLSRGDFNINAHFHTAGNSYVYLNFNCDTQLQMAPFERPTIFDGLTSSLFGSDQSLMNNTQEVAKLVGAILDTPSEQVSYQEHASPQHHLQLGSIFG